MPFIKLTVPVGVPVPDAGATTTLNVTLAPGVTAVAEAVSVVVDAVRAGPVTVTVVALEALGANVELPAYEAVIEWVSGFNHRVALPDRRQGIRQRYLSLNRYGHGCRLCLASSGRRDGNRSCSGRR